jgi:large subunit ribosomal protein L6
MSRIGRKPIPIAKGVKISVEDRTVAIQGPKGNLAVTLPGGIAARVDDGRVLVERAEETAREKALHGLVRSLIANAVTGVTDGFSRELEIQGIGYKANVEGRDVVLSLGYSHPVRFAMPAGVDISVEKQVRLLVKGADKQAVGQVAANLRSLRPPDVYKGKGIRYAGEFVRKKVGKAGAK